MYGVDIKDLTNYDLIVDTTYVTPEEVAEVIVNAYEAWRKDKQYKRAYISPLRLNYPDDETDGEVISELSARLEGGLDIPEVVLVENDGEFYVKGSPISALAYSFGSENLIPARLEKYSGEAESRAFVKMKNSL